MFHTSQKLMKTQVEETLSSSKVTTNPQDKSILETTIVPSLIERNIFIMLPDSSSLLDVMFSSLEELLKSDHFRSASLHYLLIPYFLTEGDNRYSSPNKTVTIDNTIKEELEVKLSDWAATTKLLSETVNKIDGLKARLDTKLKQLTSFESFFRHLLNFYLSTSNSTPEDVLSKIIQHIVN